MQAKSAHYQASTLVRDILRAYNLKPSPTVVDKLRKKIESICADIKVTADGKEMSLWEKSAKPQGNQTRHYFTSAERVQILTSDVLREYIIKNMFDDKAAQAYCEAQKEADEANLAYREMMDAVTYESTFEQEQYGIRWDEVRQKKLEMMIEALFVKVFGARIDVDKLWTDMEISSMGGCQDNTPESIMAEKRLRDAKNYLL